MFAMVRSIKAHVVAYSVVSIVVPLHVALLSIPLTMHYIMHCALWNFQIAATCKLHTVMCCAECMTQSGVRQQSVPCRITKMQCATCSACNL